MLSVSCNKGDDAAMGKGSYSVIDSDGTVLDESTLSWGGYFYDADPDAYDIFFLENDYFSALPQKQAIVDIDKQFCGEVQDLTQNLDGSYSLYLFTDKYQFYSGHFSSGTLLVSVDENKNTVTVKVDGIANTGEHLKINWSGKAVPSGYYLYENGFYDYD